MTTAAPARPTNTDGIAGPTRQDAKKGATKGGKAEKKSFLKSKKGIIALVAVLGVGGGAYKMLAPAGAETPVGGEVVPMDATTLNLQGGHYLKVALGIQLVEGKGTAEEFKSSQAASLVIDEFSDRTVASVSTNAARKLLVTDLEKKIKEAYDGEVYAIFLTQFVTQ